MEAGGTTQNIFNSLVQKCSPKLSLRLQVTLSPCDDRNQLFCVYRQPYLSEFGLRLLKLKKKFDCRAGGMYKLVF